MSVVLVASLKGGAPKRSETDIPKFESHAGLAASRDGACSRRREVEACSVLGATDGEHRLRRQPLHAEGVLRGLPVPERNSPR